MDLKIRVDSSGGKVLGTIMKCRNDQKLTNFVIKEQGKCFELARTGRELILLLREDENNEGVEDLLNVRPPPILG